MATTNDHSFLSEQAPSVAKRIIVCCDGTWQSSVSLDPEKGVPSNVTRLCRVLAKAGTDSTGKVWEQIVYYDAGVGTGGISNFEARRQGGLGIGLLENVMEAYNFVVNNYSPGDELFFFGFSRGAYTTRSTAGLATTIGVIKPWYLSDFIRLYHEYVALKPAKRKPSFADHPSWVEFVKKNPDLLISSNKDVKIKVIGVWDTVGALGVPDMGHWFKLNNSDWREKYEFHDVEINNRVENAYQALALDEQRSAFSPSVWKLTPENTRTNLCQCWFPGAHINIGGGSSSNAGPNPTGDREQLASISYAWMLDCIRPHLALDSETYNKQFEAFEELAHKKDAVTAKTKEGWFTWAWNKVAGASEIVLPDGYALGKIDDSHTFLYDVMGKPQPRTPGGYHDSTKGEFTTERVHPSVHIRQVATTPKNGEKYEKYQPIAMAGWERILEKYVGGDGAEKTGWQWVKWNKGKTKKERFIWEFRIGEMWRENSAEYRLIKNSWAGTEVWNDVRKGWGEVVA
ncbi:hypothetical protein EX30DRAFT_372331 [Ascodesmis nigricans]|uniref:T6SS Phospholipase effector Tle1-like catalytic domain-containing protein n=1 Tax=Ascodesmis nigricans TaxID=341454 RepID=A0A4S2MV21_9PEZI|nr:hypothetical protein EX30DRAFT_372331 [Ascodesmis nigricans]